MRAVVRDLCSRADGARVLSVVGMGMGAVPLVVPILNSEVAAAFGWRATLIVFVVYLIVTLSMALAWFDETLAAPDPNALAAGDLARALRGALGHRQALGYMLCCMFGYAGLAVWISSAPHLLLEYFHQPPALFGLWWAIPVAGYVLGGYLSARGLGRHSSDVMLQVGTTVLLVAAGGLVLLLAAKAVLFAPFMVFASLYTVGWAIVQPQAQAGALAFFPQIAGRVSAVLGCLQMLGGACIGLLFGYLHDGSPRTAILLIAFSALGAAAARVSLASRVDFDAEGTRP
jgi:MFS transporter, DHA1 family, multidrug resistance protein